MKYYYYEQQQFLLFFLLKRVKRRKSKGIQLYNDTSIKEKIAEIAVVHNNNTSKARFKKEKESKKEKIDIREIRDKEIQKIFEEFQKIGLNIFLELVFYLHLFLKV